ncbi:hypothetical protein K402DRAFT_429581 [Aulographum hederae CBS 113979]|uniref:Uncharacterized protein n=1 Tax=Aulographum hederae CBS 113979 TaxID=1176131 RepID=A0A6G1H1J1_9PEZI|nr:hypothetical protein K402DRAFT_441723 [Aulographum hederae CBS 113979]KAF1982995.1 hypothetical protein K402DRAFT_437308 [Aulographum hederae CBS 113979]KAF1986917.1 hypothetical protein K402DRAFT_429581 [Aulographum hederae CBS 113979]
MSDNCNAQSPARQAFRDYPQLSKQVVNSVSPSLYRACGPEHLRASLTCYCQKLPLASDRNIAKQFF